MKTIAAILVEQNKDLLIDEVEIPQLGYGQVLVDVKVSRICGSQIGEIRGVKGADKWLPHLLGHEGGGEVLEVGPEVKTVKPGDRVVLHWRPGAGIEARPASYKLGSKTVNAGPITTFNKLAVVSENRVTKVPSTLDYEICALLADTITTGFGVINNNAKVKIGQSVVVIGCGGIGLGTVLGASLAGAYPVIAVDVVESKLEAAKRNGATHVINSKDVDFVHAVKEIVGPGGADVVVDGTGSPEIIAKAFGLTHNKGACVLVGVMHHEKQLSINTLPLHFDKKIIGSEGGSSQPHIEIPRYVRMIESGKLDLSSFVSHRYALKDINAGIQEMIRGEVLHAMIHF